MLLFDLIFIPRFNDMINFVGKHALKKHLKEKNAIKTIPYCDNASTEFTYNCFYYAYDKKVIIST